MHTLRVHHNCKIDTAPFEQGKRPPHRRDLRLGRSSRVMRGHIAFAGSRGKKFSCGRKTKPTTGSLAIPWLVRPLGGFSQSQQQGARFGPAHTPSGVNGRYQRPSLGRMAVDRVEVDGPVRALHELRDLSRVRVTADRYDVFAGRALYDRMGQHSGADAEGARPAGAAKGAGGTHPFGRAMERRDRGHGDAACQVDPCARGCVAVATRNHPRRQPGGPTVSALEGRNGRAAKPDHFRF
jgi:hypothetical protein